MGKTLLNIGATISAILLLWLAISVCEIGFSDSLGERNFSEWNAIVIFMEGNGNTK